MIRGIPWKKFISDLKNKVTKDQIPNGAAALAYYLTLAIFPALILLLSLVAYLPVANVDQAILDLLRQLLPTEAVSLLSGVVQGVTSNKNGGLLSIGALGTLWAASNGTYAIMQELNMTYNAVEERPFIRIRGIAVGLTLLVGFLVITSFSLIVLGGSIETWMSAFLRLDKTVALLFAVLRWGIILATSLLAFAVLYYFGPNVKQDFKYITPGSVVGVGALIGVSLLFRLYVTHFGNYNATYGSLGAAIILMLWLYFTGLVILLGSEVNALLETYATGRKPEDKQNFSRNIA